ncbi:extracellular solute-binding protein [Micromonospora sp. NPDC051543]|uniref:extracellular solute-binding protein n=1 Tax=Micromonospora sp. NPDC051543 TaxID=3364287 RepID=UPI0037B7D51C
MPEKTVIHVWMADLTFPHYMDRLWAIGERFEAAHPEYEVRIEGLDFRTLPLRIAQASAEGRAPALAEFYFTVTQAALDVRDASGRPQFTSLERAVAGRSEILGEPVVIDDLVPAVRAYYSVDGELMSMPTAGTTPLLYANRQLLDAAGITRLPSTWEELEEACALVRRAPGGPPHGITWANHGLWFQQALAVQGGLLCDGDNGRSARATRVHLDSPEMLAWVRWWQRLHAAGHYLDTGRIPDWLGTLRAFAEQRTAFRISSSADVNYTAQAARENGFELVVGRFPYPAGVRYAGNAVAGTSLWLADGLDEVTRDGALAFLQFLNNPENDAARHRADSAVPLTNAGFDLLAGQGWFDDHPHQRVASDQLNSYPPGLADEHRITSDGQPPMWGALFGDFSGAQDVMTRAMADVLARGAEPAARFRRATAEAQTMLEAYALDCRRGGPVEPQSLRVEFFADAEDYSGADLEDVAQLHS